MIELRSANFMAKINPENQQLCSLALNGKELLHGAGLPSELQTSDDRQGWNNTEIVMFPVVGPVKNNRIALNGKEFFMAQHGIARHMRWKIADQSVSRVLFKQKYVANTPVPNSKIPEPLSWPWSYEITKKFFFENGDFVAAFTIKNLSDTPMPCAFGWHPAFRTTGEQFVAGETYSLKDVQAASKKGALLIDENSVSYGRIIISSNAKKFMLWSPSDNVVCVESVTRFPEFDGLESLNDYSLLQPGETVSYYVKIE